MALPTLTPEQRQAALESARKARLVRAALLEKLKTGQTQLADVFSQADAEPNGPVAKTKVTALVKALPGYGPKKSAELLGQIGIAETRRIRGLGEQQRKQLLAATQPQD
jgi:hypothetical protein